MAKNDQARVELTRRDEIPPWPRNPKMHDHAQIEASLTRFGFIAPVIFDEKEGKLVAGHGRLETLDKMKEAGKPPPTGVKAAKDGVWMVPVLRGIAFKNAQEAEAYLIADNRLSEIGGWDDAKLQEILKDLRDIADDGAGLTGIGYSDKEITALLRASDPERQHGLEPEEKMDGYIHAGIKQLVLFFPAEQYDAVIKRLEGVRERLKTDNNTDAIVALLSEHEALHGVEVEDGSSGSPEA